MARSSATVQHPRKPPLRKASESDASAAAAAPPAPAGGFHAAGANRPLPLRSGLRPAAVDLEAPADTQVAVERERRHGRGAQSNASGRYEPLARIALDDGWQSFEELPPFKTTVTIDNTRKIITRNNSPDISFDRSINPYRGCEHGCIYCFARPTHAYLGLSPGLDFESKLFAKPDAPKLLERELSAPGYEPRTIAIGTNTDPYQPIEREHQVMRRILEVLDRCGHPVGIVTKSALVLRDVDILARMAETQSGQGRLSVTTLDGKLARVMEPRAATPARRLEALRQLGAAGVPASVMVAPVIPALNDSEIERILDAAAAAGVAEAGYVLLRLPLEVRDLFREWLMANFPDRYRHVFKLMRETRGGKDYNSTFGSRMTGGGPVAWMIGRRFELACEQARLEQDAEQSSAPSISIRRGRGHRSSCACFDHPRRSQARSIARLTCPARRAPSRHESIVQWAQGRNRLVCRWGRRKFRPTFRRERAAIKRGLWPVAGCDEAGRGPLAGPVVAAAVILDPRRVPRGLDDSKKLDPDTREKLHARICATAEVAVAFAPPSRIDRDNILRASLWALARAVAALPVRPKLVFVDGRDRIDVGCDCERRDRRRCHHRLDRSSVHRCQGHARSLDDAIGPHYPGYGFEHHKGYSVPEHFDALARLGPTIHHRRSFAPVAACYGDPVVPGERRP